jgi:hypothetical protein
MKKLFIGLLLIAAAGTGVYFYLKLKKQNSPAPSSDIDKEKIIGKWNVDSVQSDINDTSFFSMLMLDSFYKTTSFTFHSEGKIEVNITSVPKTDTGFYVFRTDSTMIWKTHAQATDSFNVRVIKLDMADMVLSTDNSQYNSTLYLKRAE